MRIDWKNYIPRSRSEWGRLVLLIVSITAFRSAIADWNDVPTGSMEPTILVGDRIFVNKVAYDLKVPYTTKHVVQWGNPSRGDIVVFFSPENGKRLVKRVIGIPGDTLALRDNRLHVNGEWIQYENSADQVSNVREISGHIVEQQYLNEHLGDVVHRIGILPAVPSRRSFGPVTVPSGRYFMMGDNRDLSADSRFFGFVDRDEIVGKATGVVLSFDRENWFLPRLDRFCRRLV